MPKTKISEYSVTNSSNTDIEGINIDEGCAPSGINNAIRELMVHLKEFQTGASGDAFTFAGGVLISGAANTITGNVLMSGTNTMTGSTTATFAAGAVGTPSIAAHGDTNTGVYFPAADEVAVAAGGSIAAAFNSHQFMGMRNRIINGAMMIDQRNAGASATIPNSTADQYFLDRYAAFTATNSNNTIQQVSEAPSGYVNSLRVTIGTGASPAASAGNYVYQVIEGTNISDLGWGTASSRTVTVSFWVRSSLTGTFSGALSNSAVNRSYPFTYSISSANTWEQKTVIIAGDTTGTWLTTTGVGIRVWFDLGSGSNFQGTAGAWTAADRRAVSSSVQLVATSSATWYITGVQLEVGSVATPFERRPYGTELALCQRYYQRIDGFYAVGFNSTTMSGSIGFPVEMRASPSLSVSGALETTDFVAANYTQSSGSVSISGAGARVSARGVMADFGNFTSITNYRVYGNLPQVNRLILSSEL